MTIFFSVSGVPYFQEFEGDEMPQLVNDIRGHIDDSFPHIATHPELPLRIVDALLDGLAMDQTDITIPLEGIA